MYLSLSLISLYIYEKVNGQGATKRSAKFAPEVNLRDPSDAGDQACKWEDAPWF